MDKLARGPWTDVELNALIDSYIEMLDFELRGLAYNKRQTNLRLQESVHRSHASIEFKFCNLSAVLRDLGHAYIDGYKPRPHYQAALRDSVVRRMSEFPTAAWAIQQTQELPRSGESASNLSQVALLRPENQITDATFIQDSVEERWGMGTVSSSEIDYWTALGHLWDRATGGSDVAAMPDSSAAQAWPNAPRPAGVSEACGWFSQGLEETAVPRLLFLVGGPGAGKSHATAEVVSRFDQINPPVDGLAHRTYRYNVGDKELLLVNDATITSTKHRRAPLTKEIDSVVELEHHMLACVNRGILIEESAAFSRHATSGGGPGQIIVSWLTNGTTSGDDLEWQIDSECHESYFQAGQLKRLGKVVARVVVVFVDVCSLLERRPDLDWDQQADEGAFSVTAHPYLVSDFTKRLGWADDATPSGSLFAKVVKLLSSPEQPSAPSEFIDPIRANLESLTSPQIRSGVLALVRAAEIVSGMKMTFREVWGTVARCIVADTPERVDRSGLEEWIHARQPTSTEPRRRFSELQQLANLRFSQTLFGVVGATRQGNFDPLSNPITRLTHLVDPMRDAVPGRFTGEFDSGWATPLADAFAGPVVSGSPIESLKAGLAPEDPFHIVLTDFDRTLDAAFVEAMQSPQLRDAERYGMIAWFGSYLGRLYAIANGIPAFRKEVCLWAEAWYLSPSLPIDLGNGLRTLLRPKRKPGDVESASFIPILDSRTDPIVGSQQKPKLALMTGDVEMKTSRNAESLFLILSEQAKEIARMPFDFPLIREAVACGHEHPGLTELTEVTSPRLERFRAARLVAKQLGQANYRVVVGDTSYNVSVAGGSR